MFCMLSLLKLPPRRLRARTSPESNSPLDGIVAREMLAQYLLEVLLELLSLGEGVLLLLFISYRALAALRRFCCSACSAADAGPIDRTGATAAELPLGTSSDLIRRR